MNVRELSRSKTLDEELKEETFPRVMHILYYTAAVDNWPLYKAQKCRGTYDLAFEWQSRNFEITIMIQQNIDGTEQL